MRPVRVLLACLAVAGAAIADDLTVKLDSVSVMVRSGFGSGSGVVYIRDGETFVWTAAHVVANLRKQREVVEAGQKRIVIEYDDPAVVQVLKQDGREIGELRLMAKVVKYSDADNGHDLALLHVRKRGHFQETAKFYLDEKIPDIGSDLYHVGSLLGQIGANSLTTGILSQHGRLLKDVVFDQTTATAFPGSSGGGVFLRTDGRYVGMVVRGAGEGFNLIVPVRRIREWAKAKDIEWALDDTKPLPSLDSIYKLSIE